MQREYLFRGKKLDNSEWVYGDLIQSINTDDKWILPISESDLTNTIAVIPETVGLLMPIKDADGKNLFEGDIVVGNRTPDNFGPVKVLEKYLEYREVKFNVTEVMVDFSLPKDLSYSERSPENNIKWKLVGNKWDNVELFQLIKNT